MTHRMRWIALTAIAANIALMIVNSVLTRENWALLHRLHATEAVWHSIQQGSTSAKCIDWRQ
jgi:hypothetical protein